MSSPDQNEITFPQDCIVGSIGDAARILAEGTEKTEEGVFISLLTLVGSACSGRLGMKARLSKDTRLYSVLLGPSATGRKSAAAEEAMEFMRSVEEEMSSDSLGKLVSDTHIGLGVGSGEGLAAKLNNHPRTVLFYDELKSLMDKVNIDGSSLLSAVTSLFDKHEWENQVKKASESIKITNARLSILGCCTIDTYETMFSPTAIGIGFTNRLFIATMRRKPPVSNPPYPDETALSAARKDLIAQLKCVVAGPMVFDFSPEAQTVWDKFYTQHSKRETKEFKRLDTFFFRLAPLFALICNKTEVDKETAETVCRLLEYEYIARKRYDPIDASNGVAKLEQRIGKVMSFHHKLTTSDLQKKTHPERDGGLGTFRTALRNLEENGQIKRLPLGGARWLEWVE